MGTDTVTLKGLRVVDVDIESKALFVSGLVPGYKNSWVTITKTGEDKKFVPLVSDKEIVADSAQGSGEPKEEKKDA
jgi:Ribosomal protein L3